MAKKRCLPSITTWSAFGPGTSCPDYVRGRRINGFSYHGSSNGNYAVEPSCPHGRVKGYVARFENVKGRSKFSGLHQIINHDGMPGSYGTLSRLFRSAAAAGAAANKHCELINQGLAGARRRRKR